MQIWGNIMNGDKETEKYSWKAKRREAEKARIRMEAENNDSSSPRFTA